MLQGRTSLMVVVVLAGLVAVATTSESSKASVGTKRTLYLPLVDGVSYDTSVIVGYWLLLLTVLTSLWYLGGDEGVHQYKKNDLRGDSLLSRHNSLDRTSDWFDLLPVFDTLLDAVEKYEKVYSAATASFKHE